MLETTTDTEFGAVDESLIAEATHELGGVSPLEFHDSVPEDGKMYYLGGSGFGLVREQGAVTVVKATTGQATKVPTPAPKPAAAAAPKPAAAIARAPAPPIPLYSVENGAIQRVVMDLDSALDHGDVKNTLLNVFHDASPLDDLVGTAIDTAGTNATETFEPTVRSMVAVFDIAATSDDQRPNARFTIVAEKALYDGSANVTTMKMTIEVKPIDPKKSVIVRLVAHKRIAARNYADFWAPKKATPSAKGDVAICRVVISGLIGYAVTGDFNGVTGSGVRWLAQKAGLSKLVPAT